MNILQICGLQMAATTEGDDGTRSVQNMPLDNTNR
jgi:hypothetical protein